MSCLDSQQCTVFTELQKGRYVYYRCSQGRGKCSLPYMREEQLSEQLADLMKNIYVPETVARRLSIHSIAICKDVSGDARKN